jgi:hypothetical protein
MAPVNTKVVGGGLTHALVDEVRLHVEDSILFQVKYLL